MHPDPGTVQPRRKFLVEIAGDVLDHGIIGVHDLAANDLECPIVAGDLPKHLQGPYRLDIWPHSEDKSEQERLFGKEPFTLEGVMIDSIQFSRLEGPDGPYAIKGTMQIPWLGEKVAGRIASFAKERFWSSLTNLQLEMDLPE